jgi:hypothetical protein
MSWFIDNANLIYILLGLVALGFIGAWWVNKRVKFLAYAGVVALLIGLVWLLTRTVPSDRMQIQSTVQTMADAVVQGDQATLFKHTARDFRYKQLDREQLRAMLKMIAAQHQITEVKIWEFDFEEVDRGKGTAMARFKATVFDREGILAIVLCIATFAREEDQWRLRSIDFRNPSHPEQAMPGAP